MEQEFLFHILSNQEEEINQEGRILKEEKYTSQCQQETVDQSIIIVLIIKNKL